jgi:hypothetical protein
MLQMIYNQFLVLYIYQIRLEKILYCSLKDDGTNNNCSIEKIEKLLLMSGDHKKIIIVISRQSISCKTFIRRSNGQKICRLTTFLNLTIINQTKYILFYKK